MGQQETEAIKVEVSHDSKVDDSDVIDDKIGKIQTEIEECRKEMIEDGNGSSVFDSKVEENLLELSNPLLEKSKDHPDRDHHEGQTQDRLRASLDEDNVKSSVEAIPAAKKEETHASHQVEDSGVGTEEVLETKKSMERPKTTLEL